MLVVGMVLGIGINTYAVDIKVYTEKWSGAKYDYHQDDTSKYDLTELTNSYNLSSNFFGFELVARRFYFCAENSCNGNVKFANGDQDLEIDEFKFGCRVVRNEVCTFDIFNGLLIIDGIKTFDEDGYAFVAETLGGNLNFYIGDKLRLQGCFEVPLEGNIYTYNMKACFLLTPNLGLTAGYRGYKINDNEDGDYYYNNSTDSYYYCSKSSTSEPSGLTLGIELNF